MIVFEYSNWGSHNSQLASTPNTVDILQIEASTQPAEVLQKLSPGVLLSIPYWGLFHNRGINKSKTILETISVSHYFALIFSPQTPRHSLWLFLPTFLVHPLPVQTYYNFWKIRSSYYCSIFSILAVQAFPTPLPPPSKCFPLSGWFATILCILTWFYVPDFFKKVIEKL